MMARALRENKVTDHNGSSRLRNVINRFVEVTHTLAGDWTIDASGIDDLILTLLREIDETMLPREFSITTDTGMAARLLVSNRRLICLDIDNTPDTSDEPAPADPEAAATLYARQLQDVFQKSRKIRVRLSGRETAAIATNISCTAQCLAESFGLPLSRQAAPGKLDAFINSVEPLAWAWMRVMSGQQDQNASGPDHMVALLKALVQRRADKAKHQSQPAQIAPTRPRCEVVQVNDKLSMVQVIEHDERALFLVDVAQVADVAEHWQRIYGSAGPSD